MDENFAGFNKGRRPKFLVGARHKMVYLRKRTFFTLRWYYNSEENWIIKFTQVWTKGWDWRKPNDEMRCLPQEDIVRSEDESFQTAFYKEV